jgi:hypothetical protein
MGVGFLERFTRGALRGRLLVFWMLPQASHTARASESPSGIRWTTSEPQELQNLIKDLPMSAETREARQKRLAHGNISP